MIAAHRFTNAYRASDRVSQFLITDVLYDIEREWSEAFARVLVFKVFNRIDTWQYLVDHVGEVSLTSLESGALDLVLEDRAKTAPLYSAAYIMPPPRSGSGPKFRRHLDLIRQMIRDRAHVRIAEARSMRQAFDVLVSYDSIGPFLAFQYLTDLNYSSHLSFAEDEYIVAGPGALRGLRKCIADPGDYDVAGVLRWVMEDQSAAFDKRSLDWTDLWGRALQLIDVQNLFCEVDKYTRAAHPELSAFAPGSRIKQKYRRASGRLSAWFPPKWGLNDRIPDDYQPPETQYGQAELFPPGG